MYKVKAFNEIGTSKIRKQSGVSPSLEHCGPHSLATTVPQHDGYFPHEKQPSICFYTRQARNRHTEQLKLFWWEGGNVVIISFLVFFPPKWSQCVGFECGYVNILRTTKWCKSDQHPVMLTHSYISPSYYQEINKMCLISQLLSST